MALLKGASDALIPRGRLERPRTAAPRPRGCSPVAASMRRSCRCSPVPMTASCSARTIGAWTAHTIMRAREVAQEGRSGQTRWRRLVPGTRAATAWTLSHGDAARDEAARLQRRRTQPATMAVTSPVTPILEAPKSVGGDRTACTSQRVEAGTKAALLGLVDGAVGGFGLESTARAWLGARARQPAVPSISPVTQTPDANRPLMALRSDNTNSPTVTDDSGSPTGSANRLCDRCVPACTPASTAPAASQPGPSRPVMASLPRSVPRA